MSEPRPSAAGPPTELDIAGGPGSFAADLQDISAAAQVLDQAGDGLRAVAGRVTRLAATGDLLAAAPICPLSTAVAEARIAATIVGPFGLLPLSALCEGIARGIEATVATYRAGDAAAEAGFEAVRHQVGVLLGSATVISALVLVTNPTLALPLLFGGVEWVRAGGPEAAAEALAEHPEILDTVLGLLPGYGEGVCMTALGPQLATLLTGGHWPTGSDEGSISGLLSLGGLVGAFREDRRFQVVPVPDGRPGGHPVTVDGPRSVADLLGEEYLIGLPEQERQVTVIEVPHPGGPSSWVVQIPGTQDASPFRTDNPVDGTSDVRLMGGRSSALLDCVVQAMEQSGIPRGEHVMIVGHSLGGIAAAALVSDPGFRSRFSVTSIVTAGSPIARFEIPASVSVLALEHRQDPIPMLDGRANPARPGWVTVTRDAEEDARAIADARATAEPAPSSSSTPGPAPSSAAGRLQLGDAHNGLAYLRTAAAVDASSDPALAASRRAQAEFLTGGERTGRRYRMVPVTG